MKQETNHSQRERNHFKSYDFNHNCNQFFVDTQGSNKGNNLKKFNQIQTNNSGTASTNQLNSKFPISTFQSCSTLQSSTIRFSIPKQERFQNNYKPPICDSIYNVPDFKNKKCTSMGYGFRKDFINKKETENLPSPGQYNFNCIFDENISKHRGYSLSQRISYKESDTKNFPGPVDYNTSKSDWLKKIGCSMKFRNIYFYEDGLKSMHDVSPMKYLPDTMIINNNRYKKYSIGFGKGLRSFEKNSTGSKTPGPGNYNLPSVFDRRKTGRPPIN